MFNLRRKLGLLAIPGAAVLIAGGAFAMVAASGPLPHNAHLTAAVQHASPAATGGSQAAPDKPDSAQSEDTATKGVDPDGPNGPNVQQGPNDQQGPDTNTGSASGR